MLDTVLLFVFVVIISFSWLLSRLLAGNFLAAIASNGWHAAKRTVCAVFCAVLGGHCLAFLNILAVARLYEAGLITEDAYSSLEANLLPAVFLFVLMTATNIWLKTRSAAKHEQAADATA